MQNWDHILSTRGGINLIDWNNLSKADLHVIRGMSPEGRTECMKRILANGRANARARIPHVTSQGGLKFNGKGRIR
jgi:hypothetical protein